MHINAIQNAGKPISVTPQAQGEVPRNSVAEQRNAQLVEQSAQVRELATRDREVRAHEQAHAAAGGQHASAPRFDYERGPNGVNYAVGGHVNIDTSPVAGDPEATLLKAQQIQRAALAPAEPSSQDRAVAAKARQMATDAASELVELLARERQVGVDGATGTETRTAGLLVDEVA